MNTYSDRITGLYKLLAIVVLTLAVGTPAMAQQAIVSRFKPDLPVFPQYFSVTQATDGTVYLGHSGGVLRFDGNRWQDIVLPARGAVRQMARGPDGRIWVGGTNTFGYLQRDERGVDTYVDLAPQFAMALGDEQFADIWHLLVTADAVYFAALRHLFAVNSDGRTLGLWRNSGRFGTLADLDGAIHVQWRGEGLKRLLPGGQFEMVDGGEQFASPLLRNLLPLAPGRALLHTTEPAVYLWEGGQVRHLKNLAPGQLKHLTGARVANENTVVFGGSDGVVRVLDVAAQSFQEAQVARGFLSGVAFADDGALLIASDSGVLRLPWPASWMKYDQKSGLSGSVHNLVFADDSVYALTGTGVFRAPLRAGQVQGPFERENWTDREAWNLLQTRGGMLLAYSHGLRRVDVPGAPLVGRDDLYPRQLLIPPTEPDFLWTGNEHGLALFELVNGQWQLVDQFEQMGLRVLSLVPADDGAVWVSAEGGGLQIARIQRDGTPQIILQPVADGSGLRYTEDGDALASQTSLGLLVSTGAGTYRHEGTHFVRDNLGGLDELKPADEVVSFIDGGDGNLWAYSYRALYSRRAGFWSMTDLATLDTGAIEPVVLGPDNALWLGGRSEIFRYLPETRAAGGGGALSLASLTRINESDDSSDLLDLTGALQLQGKQLGLNVQYRLSDLEQAGSTVYRSRLVGLSDQWSPWTRYAEANFAKLGPGSYALEAEARTGTGRIYTLAPRSFEVVPQWHETSLVRGSAMAVVAVFMLWLVTTLQRGQMQRLATRNQELDQMVKMRTEDLRRANSKLRDQAERDALTGVGNRRLFDQRMGECFEAAGDGPQGMALLLVDVDHFKSYNDTHGHQAGDWVLSKLASILADNVRDDTVVTRYGGEEFGIIVPRCDALSAARLARRLVREVQQELGGVTISIGVAAFDTLRDTRPENLVSRADQALYSAKHQGRNRFVMAA